jgi:hypothetical protein
VSHFSKASSESENEPINFYNKLEISPVSRTTIFEDMAWNNARKRDREETVGNHENKRCWEEINTPKMGYSSQTAYSQNSMQHSLPFHFLKEVEKCHGSKQENG